MNFLNARVRNFVIISLLPFLLSTPASATLLQKKVILFLGDSITEGLGVSKDDAYPALVEKKLNKTGWQGKVINAGFSGATSASGVSRLKWQLKNKPDLLFLALGANDGLRGLEITSTQKNLIDTISLAKKEKIEIILAGMQMPPNYGARFTEDFKQMFVSVAREQKIHFFPFLLEGVAADKKLNQADGIHPNEKGHQVIAENVFNALKGFP